MDEERAGAAGIARGSEDRPGVERGELDVVSLGVEQ
jgi:hypothetical protein